MTPLHLKTPLPEEKQAVLIIMDRVARRPTCGTWLWVRRRATS